MTSTEGGDKEEIKAAMQTGFNYGFILACSLWFVIEVLM